MKELDEYRPFMQKEEMHKSINCLVGLLTGVLADGVVNEAEQMEIQMWYSLHKHLANKHPFNQIIPAISSALSDDKLDVDEIESVVWLCHKMLNERECELYFNFVTCKIQKLESILHGIISDGNISDDEIAYLMEWLDENEDLCGVYPFDEVYSLLVTAREDGLITQDERNMLKAFFATFVDTRESYNINEEEIARLQQEYTIGGICAVCPEILLEKKTFSFTGVSKRAKRKEIAEMITNAGGLYHDRVTNDTDYLVVGAEGNPCWAFSCYGRKVEQAVNLRKQGKHIVIVHEFDLWDEIG